MSPASQCKCRSRNTRYKKHRGKDEKDDYWTQVQREFRGIIIYLLFNHFAQVLSAVSGLVSGLCGNSVLHPHAPLFYPSSLPGVAANCGYSAFRPYPYFPNASILPWAWSSPTREAWPTISGTRRVPYWHQKRLSPEVSLSRLDWMHQKSCENHQILVQKRVLSKAAFSPRKWSTLRWLGFSYFLQKPINLFGTNQGIDIAHIIHLTVFGDFYNSSDASMWEGGAMAYPIKIWNSSPVLKHFSKKGHSLGKNIGFTVHKSFLEKDNSPEKIIGFKVIKPLVL